MATAGWRTPHPLNQLIFSRYGSFNVFQLMRLLLWKRAPANDGGTGEQLNAWPISRRLHFRADLSASFPGREISRLSSTPPDGELTSSVQKNGDLVYLSTANYCVASTLGPLPEPFMEWVRDLEHDREYAMSNFLNVFNRRLNLIRVQLKMRQTLALNTLLPAETPHAQYLASLMGLGMPSLSEQIPLHPRAWLGLAGLLSNCRKSAPALTHVLSLFLGAKVTLEPFVGAWQTMEPADHAKLGRRNHQLGQQTVVGRRIWDQQARVRLHVAALDYARFCGLLPSTSKRNQYQTAPRTATEFAAVPCFDRFLAMLRLMLDRACDCEVHLQLANDNIPPSILTAKPNPELSGYWGLRLGHTAWLRNKEATTVAQLRSVTYLVPAFDRAEAA